MYSMPALDSKYPLLVDSLNHFLQTYDFAPFDLKRLKKEAEDVKNNVDLASGFALLGMISCLEKDEESVRSYFKRAIEQSGGAIWHIGNFAISLKHLGLIEDAYEYAKEAYEKNPVDTESINIAIEMACILNNKVDFEELTRMWRKIEKKRHPLEIAPLFRDADQKKSSELLEKYKSEGTLPSGHLDPGTIFTKCGPEIRRIFGSPLNIVVDVMPDPDSKPNLVAWIQWFGEMDEGMGLYDQFEQWYIDHDYDLKTDIVSFNIEFVGA